MGYCNLLRLMKYERRDVKQEEEEETETDTEKAAYRTQYQREVSRLGSLTSGLEVDALLSGSKGLKEVFEANMMLGGAYAEAGISVNDSDETKQLKIDEHKAGAALEEAVSQYYSEI